MGNKHKPRSTEEGGSYPTEGTRKPGDDSEGGKQASLDRRQDYAVFISHSWDYDQEYARLVRLLEEANRFDFRDYSVPQEEQFDTETDEELERVLREKQIKPSSVVVVLAGLYSTHSDWIGKEVRIAEEEGKPILGVEPWGNDRTSNYVEQHADEMVSWNTDSIVDGIRDLAP
ncbi:TIR domain-containing protein [Halosimplex halobium]|uniref:TIR domain-containing protein n=1 Tax=Halosimplex halobium TaxID=3396618 RepID=UPI003F564A8E